MLNKTESQILTSFINIYELKITNSIQENFQNMNIIFDEEHIPNSIINKFFMKSKDYLNNILEYALSYALLHNNVTTINIFKKLNTKINDVNSLNDEEKRNILYNSIKYLLSKKNNNIKESEIRNLKQNNFNLYGIISGYYHFKTINNLYKEIIINLSKYTQKIIDNKLLEDLILSNKYDDNLIEVSNNILKNKQDIKFFKLTLVRMILSSTFIIELSLMQEFLSKHQNLSESGLVTTPELIFINYCIENNDFCLPTDENILENMLNLFIVYNKTNNNDKIAYAEKNYPHELKKIYPLYMFDKLN